MIDTIDIRQKNIVLDEWKKIILNKLKNIVVCFISCVEHNMFSTV